jgi:hypothetical protein
VIADPTTSLVNAAMRPVFAPAAATRAPSAVRISGAASG